jgi:hypothetical protein
MESQGFYECGGLLTRKSTGGGACKSSKRRAERQKALQMCGHTEEERKTAHARYEYTRRFVPHPPQHASHRFLLFSFYRGLQRPLKRPCAMRRPCDWPLPRRRIKYDKVRPKLAVLVVTQLSRPAVSFRAQPSRRTSLVSCVSRHIAVLLSFSRTHLQWNIHSHAEK